MYTCCLVLLKWIFTVQTTLLNDATKGDERHEQTTALSSDKPNTRRSNNDLTTGSVNTPLSRRETATTRRWTACKPILGIHVLKDTLI